MIPYILLFCICIFVPLCRVRRQGLFMVTAIIDLHTPYSSSVYLFVSGGSRGCLF